MSLGVANRAGGRTSERALYSGFGSTLEGDVISGFRVRQAVTPAMSVRVGGEWNPSLLDDRGRLIDLSDNAMIRDGLGFYSVFTNDGTAVTATVSPAHASLPRIDTVVMYIKKDQARVKSPVDNVNGVVLVKVVSGTPAASPVAPTPSMIQTSIEAGNPFIKLSNLDIPAAATTVTSGMIKDVRMSATGTGKVIAFGADEALRPDNTLPATGISVDIDKYPMLFRYIGHKYAFDENNVAKTPPAGQFFLPNYQGRVLVGLKPSDTDFSTLGKSGGAKTHTLTAAQQASMPVRAGSDNILKDSGGLGGWRFNAAGANDGANTFIAVGGGLPHNNLQPYGAANFVIIS